MSDGTAWRRLSVRIVHLDVLRLAASTAVGGLGLALDGGAAVRPLLIGAAIGVLGALADLARWLTTSYRVTEDRVELRSGRLVRRHRTVPRDRIRTLDSSATVRHRLFGLRVLHVGSGDPESSFTLDALPVAAVTRLQQELGAGSRPVTGAGEEPDDGQSVPGTAPGAVIARLRPSWVAYNAVTPGAVLVLVGPLLAAYGFLRPSASTCSTSVAGSSTGSRSTGRGRSPRAPRWRCRSGWPARRPGSRCSTGTSPCPGSGRRRSRRSSPAAAC